MPHPPQVFSIRGLRLYFSRSWSPGLRSLLRSPTIPPYLCANMGPWGLPATTLWDLLAAAWPALLHSLPPPQSATSLGPPAAALPQILSTQAAYLSPPTGLDECFFFNSLVVGLPYNLIFCQFWLFFIFKFVVFFLLVVRGGTVCLPIPSSWPEVLT